MLILRSSNNYTLKYVDASFYQVARGLVLPLTVLTSFIFLNTRPSIRILLSCSIVTVGFFVGVFLDGTHVSTLGIVFGVASSLMTALHAVVMKRSLDVVGGSALHLSWYSNLLSAMVLAPCVLFVGEGSSVMDLLYRRQGLATFITGSTITVRPTFMTFLVCAHYTSRAHLGFSCPLRALFQSRSRLQSHI